MEPSCAYQNMGGYPIESMFRENVYITGYDQRIWVIPDEQKVYQLFRLEKKIYVFDGNTNGLIQTIPIEPDYFADIIYRKDDSIENVMFSLQRNPKFLDFVVGNQFIVIRYIPGLKQEDVSASSSMVGFNEKMRTLPRYISIYDRNGNKIGADFSHDHINFLIGFDKKERFLFQKESEDESVIIYKAELVPPVI